MKPRSAGHLHVSRLETMGQLGDFLLFLVVWVLMVVTVFDAVRRLVVSGYSRSPVIEIIAATATFAVLGGLYFYAYIKADSLVTKLDEDPYVQLRQDWGMNEPPEAREKASRSYVTAAFMGHGRLLNYVNISGEWVQFQPSQQLLSEREHYVVLRTQMQEQATSFFNLALRWWLSWLIAALLGFFAGRRKAAQPALKKHIPSD